MQIVAPKQAFATREAHDAVLELKKLVDDAENTIHAAELESFHVAISRESDSTIRKSLQNVIDHLKSPKFDTVLSAVRDKLQTAVSV